MKISTLKIKNFKTFDSEGVFFNLNDLSALIGENSVGKSNVLEALDLFFNFSKTKVNVETFHHNDFTKEIEIEIKFIGLSEDEKETFKSHLSENEELIVTQKIYAKTKEEDIELSEAIEEDLEFAESKHGSKIKPTEEYEWATLNDKAPTKKNIKAWWKQELIVGDFNFKSYFESEKEPTPEDFQSNLKRLWHEHSDKIPVERITGDEKMLGWKNKLKANLPKYFYIPAIKNLKEDLKLTSSSPLGEMINWLSRTVSKEVKEEFKEKSSNLVNDLLKKIDKDEDGNSKIESLNQALNNNVGVDIGCKLELRFGDPEIQDVVFPEPKIFANDGYDSELTQKGHGIQRLSIFSLLRTYNTFQFDKDKPRRNIIIGIEEPEIYLHPPIKRATYSLLRKISENSDQVIYTTHDNYFISVENFDEIKLFRKKGETNPKTLIYEFSIEALKKFFEEKYNLTIEKKSLRHRFQHIIDESKNEGFFAKKVILIEGETEKYSLPNYFSAKGFDLDENRVALINAGSVDNISHLLVIFNEFRIPCYIIFDGDKPKDTELQDLSGDNKKDAKKKSKRNKELYELLGLEVSSDELFFPDTYIGDQHAVWKYDFETVFHETLENYSELKQAAKELYGNDSKPLTARYISERITQEHPEMIDEKIEQLIEKIKNLKWKESIVGTHSA